MVKKSLSSLLLTASVAVNGIASAGITAPTTIDFTGMGFSSFSGKGNIAPVAGGNCPGTGGNGCYIEDGVVTGIIDDPSNVTAHVHRNGTISAAALGYHSDAPGIYIRAQDSTAFRLSSLDFHAPISVENPGNGVNDVWEILGFSTALNPGLDAGDGTNYPTRVAYQTVANGFNGILTLNSAFQNISALWIHYKGYTRTPIDGKTFGMEIDNLALNAPVVNTATSARVPVPAVAAWLLGACLMSLMTVVGRKKPA